MATLETTNNDTGAVEIWEPVYQDDTLNFAGADDLAKGTILARDSVSLKLVIYVKGGVTNENGIPKAILPYDVSAAGAGDVAVKVAVAGQMRKSKLIIDADGDDSNIDAAVLDQLRDFTILGRESIELGEQDNQ